MGRRVRVQSGIVGLFIGLGCLGILLRQVDLKQSLSALSRLNGPYMTVPPLILFVNLPLRGWRWQLIFPSSMRPNLRSCLTVLGIGNMANFLLPGRAGDIARCALVGAPGSFTDTGRAVGTLAVEKVLDGLALVGMVLFSVWALRPPYWVLELVRLAVVIFAFALSLLVFLHYRTRPLIDIIRRGARRVYLSHLEERFDKLFTSFSDGLSAVSSAPQMVVLIVLTAAIWSSEAVAIWGLGHALGLAVSLKSAVIASAVLGLGLMIPAAPGGLGTYELFGTEAFKLVGIAASSALALTIVIHAWVFVANIAIGIALLGVQGLSLAQLRRRVDSGTSAEVEASPCIRPLR